MKKSFYASTALAVALTSLLLACGGGGGSSGSTGSGGTGSGGTTGPNAPAPAAKFDVSFNRGSLPSNNTEQADLTVTALNANGGIVAGAPVMVSVDSGIFIGASSPAVTGADGTFKGSVKVGGNRANRIINVSVTAAGQTVVNPIIVTGSTLTINDLPATISTGTTVNNVLVKFTDSSNNPVGQQSVNLTQPLGAGITLSTAFPAMTDADGIIRFNLTVAANAAPGARTLALDAGGSRTPATRLFTVATSAANTVPVVPAGTVISTTSVLANPTFITTNSAGDMTNKSQVVAKFLDATNIGIENLRVRFRISSNILAGEQLSPNSSIAPFREYETFTNAAGQATVNYVAGTRSSPTNGVTIEACYRRNDTDPWTTCVPAAAQITVGGQALDIAIFDGNKIQGVGNANQIYEQTLVIQIADAAGNAAGLTNFSASVDITHYGKSAAWANLYPSFPSVPTIIDTYLNPGIFVLSANTAPAAGNAIWCVAEDTNRNGSLDTGEDTNNNQKLDPKKSDIAISFPKGKITDVDGRGEIKVSYGQNVGGWLAYTVKVSANVAGSEGSSSRSFITTVLKSDVDTGSFLTPPYGTGACNQAN